MPGTVDVLLLVTRCYLQASVRLDEIEIVPLGEALGFRGELDYTLAHAEELGFVVRADFQEAQRRALETRQPCAIVVMRGVEASTPEEAEVRSAQLEREVASVLSLVTCTPVEPIARVVLSDGGSKAAVRILAPEDRWIQHLNGHFQRVPGMIRATRTDPRFLLSAGVFRDAIRSTNAHLALFHYVQCLEVASSGRSGSLGERIREMMTDLELGGELTSIPERLGVHIPQPTEPDSVRDLANLLVAFRNALAHEGEITMATVKPEWARPFVPKLEELVSEVNSLTQFALVLEFGR